VDEESGAIAAIHSGWKGTFNSITKKTIIRLKEEYGVSSINIKAYIGPHIRKCCYEVSEELKEKFLSEKKVDESILFNGRNLSMEECIVKDLEECGVKGENINSLTLCTHCSNEVKLHSYRASNGSYGRLFSFVLIK
jgi:copper oxidase (laccase) domain-containing protein